MPKILSINKTTNTTLNIDPAELSDPTPTPINNKRKRVDNVRPPKTSYFDTTVTSNQGKGTGRNKATFHPNPPINDKIVFLVSDTPSPRGESATKRPKKNNKPSPDDVYPPCYPTVITNDPPNKNTNPMDAFFNELFKELFNNPISNNNGGPPTAPKKKQGDASPTTKEIECNNPICNHKTLAEDPALPTIIEVDKIQTLDDLITLGKAFHCKKQTSHQGLNLRLMNELVPPLVELKDMIGMHDVKSHVVDQILFFLQGFNTNTKCNKCQDCVHGLPCVQTNTEMLHTVITGPPGVGKTCLGRIMGKVYNAMGILSNGIFHEVTRADFIAGYLGQTALKTQKLIDSCKGGVMFIDEAYSMGSKEQRDSFAKEALDTLNKHLSDNRDMLCIIAGYEKDLEECFFAANSGLKRRFTFRYNVDEYDYNELLDIFKLKVEKEGWTIDFNSQNLDEPSKYSEEDLLNLFRSHKDSFPYCGGDVETYFLQCKIVHGRRMPDVKKCLSFGDLEKGFEKFTKNRKTKRIKKQQEEDARPNMYNLV